MPDRRQRVVLVVLGDHTWVKALLFICLLDLIQRHSRTVSLASFLTVMYTSPFHLFSRDKTLQMDKGMGRGFWIRTHWGNTVLRKFVWRCDIFSCSLGKAASKQQQRITTEPISGLSAKTRKYFWFGYSFQTYDDNTCYCCALKILPNGKAEELHHIASFLVQIMTGKASKH